MCCLQDFYSRHPFHHWGARIWIPLRISAIYTRSSWARSIWRKGWILIFKLQCSVSDISKKKRQKLFEGLILKARYDPEHTLTKNFSEHHFFSNFFMLICLLFWLQFLSFLGPMDLLGIATHSWGPSNIKQRQERRGTQVVEQGYRRGSIVSEAVRRLRWRMMVGLDILWFDSTQQDMSSLQCYAVLLLLFSMFVLSYGDTNLPIFYQPLPLQREWDLLRWHNPNH